MLKKTLLYMAASIVGAKLSKKKSSTVVIPALLILAGPVAGSIKISAKKKAHPQTI
jgi:hypothetical protein